MHPLVAEDFVKVLVEERIGDAERYALLRSGRNSRRVRKAIGTALVRAGTRLGRLEARSALTAGNPGRR